MNNETESETSLRARVSVFRVWDSLFYYKKVLLLPQFWWKHCIERIYESETETESSQSHGLDSESETETSPEPRDSGFWVRDKRLGKFWYTWALTVLSDWLQLALSLHAQLINSQVISASIPCWQIVCMPNNWVDDFENVADCTVFYSKK